MQLLHRVPAPQVTLTRSACRSSFVLGIVILSRGLPCLARVSGSLTKKNTIRGLHRGWGRDFSRLLGEPRSNCVRIVWCIRRRGRKHLCRFALLSPLPKPCTLISLIPWASGKNCYAWYPGSTGTCFLSSILGHKNSPRIIEVGVHGRVILLQNLGGTSRTRTSFLLDWSRTLSSHFSPSGRSSLMWRRSTAL